MATAAAAAAACERKASLDPLGLPPKQQQQSGQAKKNRARQGEVAKRTSWSSAAAARLMLLPYFVSLYVLRCAFFAHKQADEGKVNFGYATTSNWLTKANSSNVAAMKKFEKLFSTHYKVASP